jgi:type I restriction enzyme S subunit
MRYEVPYLPPLAEQQTIAATLSALDDKIANNRGINNHLELMAQAIFKELCSEGERVVLSDILTVCYGKDHKRLGGGDVPCYGSGGIMRYVDKALYDGESVLIPRKGSLNNVLYINEPFWTVDTMFYTHMTHPNVAKFVYFTVRNLDLAGMNVGSAVPSMTTTVLNTLEIMLPCDEILASFEGTVSPMFLQIQANNEEVIRLSEIRDVLLPRLMSGELSAADVDAK